MQSDVSRVRQVRASFDDLTLVVYQAFSPAIADAALIRGTLTDPFKLSRMTWIKPSFLWMMHRSNWARNPGQERILAIRILREGFECALAAACLSSFETTAYRDQAEWRMLLRDRPNRVQWDPERDESLRPLPIRTLQVGLGPPYVERYVSEWIVDIEDITTRVQELQYQMTTGEKRRGGKMPTLPCEQALPLPETILKRIGASPTAM